jgi:hypothetical protein
VDSCPCLSFFSCHSVFSTPTLISLGFSSGLSNDVVLDWPAGGNLNDTRGERRKMRGGKRL